MHTHTRKHTYTRAHTHTITHTLAHTHRHTTLSAYGSRHELLSGKPSTYYLGVEEVADKSSRSHHLHLQNGRRENTSNAKVAGHLLRPGCPVWRWHAV